MEKNEKLQTLNKINVQREKKRRKNHTKQENFCPRKPTECKNIISFTLIHLLYADIIVSHGVPS